MKLWIVKTLKVWHHMIFTPSPCHKLSHFLRPPSPLERDIFKFHIQIFIFHISNISYFHMNFHIQIQIQSSNCWRRGIWPSYLDLHMNSIWPPTSKHPNHSNFRTGATCLPLHLEQFEHSALRMFGLTRPHYFYDYVKPPTRSNIHIYTYICVYVLHM